MKTLLKVLGLLLVLLVAIALLAPMFISMDDITQTIADEVEATTGRTLAVDGEKSLSVFPSLALQLEQVRFSNSAGGSRPDMATIERLDVHIPWLSLLSGELNVEQFVISNPDILLEIDAAGNANWDIMPAGPAPEAPAGEATSLPAGFDVSLGEVAIYGGRVRLLNHQAGSEQLVEELDLVIGLPSLQEDLTLKGMITWMGEVLELSVALTTPAQLLAGQPVDLELTLDSRLLAMVYRGNISEGGGRVTGSLELSGDSLQKLAAWQEVVLEGGDDAFNRFALSGDMVFAADVLEISGLEARLDALEIKGSSTLSLTEPPDIRANLDLGLLDLNPYLPPPAVISEATRAAASDAPAQAVEWDDTPIDLSALKSVNAEIELRSSGLRARDIKLGENELLLRMKAGKLDLGLEKFSAYQGSGTGAVTVDARRTPYSVTTDFSLSGISAQPLLTDVMGFDKLLGSGQLQWQLTTRGVSQKDFVSALAGELGFKFSDGAINGVNIAALVRGAQGLLEGDASGLGLAKGFDEAEQTDFSELGGTLLFTNGVGSNDDLAMASPLLRVSGKGEVNLPKANIDYRLTSRLVSTIEGQAATGKAKGVAIPLRIKGPFHNVKIKPDVSQAAEEKVKDTIKDELFKRFGKKP